MALFDELTRKATKFTEEAVDKTQELASSAKTKLKVKSLEADCYDAYCELGRYYYQLVKDENSVDEYVADLRNRIFDLEAEIEDLKIMLDEGR